MAKTNMMRDGLAWFTDQIATHASETIIYARGPNSVEASASLGTKLLKISDGEGGIRLERTDLDVIIPAADLFALPLWDEPRRGDLVYVTTPNDVQAFEVLPYGGEESCWHWTDPIGQTQYRIHTKHVS